MNKLMGFYELKQMRLPLVPWREYAGGEELEPNRLWTVRSAVFQGNDLNLPRPVGATAEEAKVFADKLLQQLNGNGIVVYYPYFVAEKSGNLNVFSNQIVIEAVQKDLWNLVTYEKRDITIIMGNDSTSYYGNEDFLSNDEIRKLNNYIPEIKAIFRNDLISGKSIMLEWSFAYDSDLENRMIGDRYLVFYEARTV